MTGRANIPMVRRTGAARLPIGANRASRVSLNQ